MSELDCSVLVVGGGPTGLLVACELVRRGVQVRVIDAAPSPFKGSRAKGLKPRSLEVLDDLGVGQEVLAAGRFGMPVRKWVGRRLIDEHLLHGPAVPTTAATPYADTLIVPQWRIENALRSRLEALGGVVEHGVRLVDFIQSDRSVLATVERRGGKEWVEAEYLIGCDGAHSVVREQLSIAFTGETDPSDCAYTADLALEGLDREAWHVWQRDSQVLALCPLPGTDCFQAQVSVPALGGQLSLTEIQELIDGFTARSDIRVRRVGWQSYWRHNARMAEAYRQGRVFLAGDSVHVHPPAGGLGMNTGIQDAYNLGWKLAAVLQGADLSLLDTYEEERLPIAAGVLQLSGVLTANGHAGTFPSDGQTRDTLQLGLHYRTSSLSLHAREGDGPRAGDRAPDALCRTSTSTRAERLFDCYRGPQAIALAAGPRSTQLASRLATHHGGDMVRAIRLVPADASGHQALETPGVVTVFDHHDSNAHTAYGIAPGAEELIVVRPDGYIGARWSSPSVESTATYVRRIVPLQMKESGSCEGMV